MQAIGQHFVGGFDGTKITPLVKKLIQKYQIGGLILFGRNIESPEQVRYLNAELQKLASVPLLIGVDQEGGPVARLKAPFTKLPPMGDVGDYYRRTKDLHTVKQIGHILGKELRAVGFNWDYAPVLDVHSNPKNPVIGRRSFSPDPAIVQKCASALIRGLHAEGVLSCAKHFPGHGATSVDSHKNLPVLKTPGRILWKRDLYPYRKLIPQKGILTLMTAHVRYTELDPENCATLSGPILTDLLRKRLAYKGLIVSDDLLMKAISDRYGIPEAARQFFEAGGDMAMICKDPEIQIETIRRLQEIVTKSKSLSRHLSQSAKRIQKLKNKFCKTSPLPSLDTIGCHQHQKIVNRVME